MSDQLILTDDTLRVIGAVLPYSPICDEIAKARDTYSGGHLTTTQVREIVTALKLAQNDAGVQLVTKAALKLAGGDLRCALRRVNLDALELDGRRTVSVFVMDPTRDTPAAIEAAHAPL